MNKLNNKCCIVQQGNNSGSQKDYKSLKAVESMTKNKTKVILTPVQCDPSSIGTLVL